MFQDRGGIRRHMVTALVAVAMWPAVPIFAHPGLDETKQRIAETLIAEPQNVEAHLARARAHESGEEWREAHKALDAAAAAGADPTIVRIERGRILRLSGAPKEARRELDRAIKRQPEAWGAYVERAAAWSALDRPNDAALDLERAVRHLSKPRPEHVIAWRDALVAAGRRSEGIVALDVGIDRLGEIPSLVLPAIELEREAGRPADARRRLERLMQASPPNPAWVALEGDLFAAEHRSAEARDRWSRALAMIEARPPARRGAAMATLEARLRASLAPQVARSN